MKRTIFAFLLLLASGCLQTFQPLYTDATTVFEPALLGRWSEDSTEQWSFAKGKEKSYAVRLMNDGDTVGEFSAHLVRLKSYLFLDLFPARLFESENRKSTYGFHFIPIHSISRVWLAGDTLRLSMLDHDWFVRSLKTKKASLSYVRRDEQYLVTASTPELQKFVVRYAENTEAFPNPGVFLRMR